MALTFPTVPTVAAGDPVTSAQMNALARGINARLRSGVGDPTFRVQWYTSSLWRQVRNRDSSGLLFPSSLEFQESYVHFDPDQTTAQWPTAGPGEFEGNNLANPMNAFVFGDPSVNSESGRLVDVELWASGPPAGQAAIWAAGQAQRGAVDISGESNAPAFTAAQEHFRIVQRAVGIHGRGYGGYLPGPAFIDYCEDGTEDTPASRNYSVFFTPLREGLPLIEYPGTCPDTAGHVLYIAKMPFAYYVYLVGGTVDRLSLEDYIEGPYTEGGGYVVKTEGQQLLRSLNLFLKEFRGSTSQREDNDFEIEDIGFDYERFFTSQYFLAPNIGHLDGDNIIADYPLYTLSGSKLAGDLFVYSGGGTSHQYEEGFVLGGFYAAATNLSGRAEIEVLNGGTVIHSFSVSEDAPEQTVWFDEAVRPNLSFRLKSNALFTSPAGKIEIQCTEQLAYKPQVHDAYLVLRLSSTHMDGDVAGGVDGGGRWTETARQIGESYFTNGMIFNSAAGQLPSEDPLDGGYKIGNNPVFEAARKFTRDNTRVVRRQNLAGYAVENGKSVLYFTREALGGESFDIFENIAPSETAIESGHLQPGRKYIVRGQPGYVTYNGVNYGPEQTFTAGAKLDFTTVEEAEVFEWTAIRHTPPPGGTTNQWLMFCQFKAYHTSETSVWKPEAYSDYFGFSNRCLFYSVQVDALNNGDLLDHFQPGALHLIAPEAPSGYNYANGINGFVSSEDFTLADFYASCRVYESDPEVESAIIDADGLVKITFKTRFHHCEEAPLAIQRDVGTWDISALSAEPHRTMENGIRDYLVHQANGTQCQYRAGDAAAWSTVQSDPDNPFGTCYPHFFFTRLIEEVYEDDNSTVQQTDSVATIDPFLTAEWYLRAICEGYIDGATSADLGCKLEGLPLLYDFTFENLCYQATGSRWLPLIPTREDDPQAFGPFPNTIFRAAHYNALAGCTNLLTRARLMLPMQLKCRTTTYRQDDSMFLYPCGTANRGFLLGHTPPDPSNVDTEGEWTNCGIVGSSSSAHFLTGACDGSDHVFTTTKSVSEYRLELLTEEVRLAIPEHIQELIDTAQTGFFGIQEASQHSGEATEVPAAEAGGCEFPDGSNEEDPPYWVDGEIGYIFGTNIQDEPATCGLFKSGEIDCGAPPAGDFADGMKPDLSFCSAGGSAKSINLSSIEGALNSYIEVPLV